MRRPSARLATLVFLALIRPDLAPAQPPPPAPDPASPQPAAKAAKPKEATRPAKAKAADDGPVVMSGEAYAASRGRAAGDGRYGAEADWREIPPWRQASFFGLRARGQVFIFVVDCSGSMDDEARLDRAKGELMRTIRAMQSPQRFKVIFYNDEPVPMPGELPKPADFPSKNQLARWLELVQPGGGTDPRGALSLALAMRPDAVFLLSDGAFPPGTAEAVAKTNPKKVPIHCVDLAGGAGGDDLRKIARDSGGQYAPRGK